ncbi:hypothetical protein Actkin_02134 [Actinokineospora sp. UTMC 2448]|nr:hypothetical protein Actkin_02134 [Actinokineospora sp. UTMC 2448]
MAEPVKGRSLDPGEPGPGRPRRRLEALAPCVADWVFQLVMSDSPAPAWARAGLLLVLVLLLGCHPMGQ